MDSLGRHLDVLFASVSRKSALLTVTVRGMGMKPIYRRPSARGNMGIDL
jgi:hypothetical protein